MKHGWIGVWLLFILLTAMAGSVAAYGAPDHVVCEGEVQQVDVLEGAGGPANLLNDGEFVPEVMMVNICEVDRIAPDDGTKSGEATLYYNSNYADVEAVDANLVGCQRNDVLLCFEAYYLACMLIEEHNTVETRQPRNHPLLWRTMLC